MAAVAHASPADLRRIALVRTSAVLRSASTSLPTSIYRRRRAVALLIVVSMVVALALAVQGVRATLITPARPGAPAQVYVVQPGDTFWDIAGRLHPGADPRPLVARMVAAHGGAVLVAGERLVLPPPA